MKQQPPNSNCRKPLKKKKEIRRLSIQPALRGGNDLRIGRKMATFQFFFQSGRAKDLSPPCFIKVKKKTKFNPIAWHGGAEGTGEWKYKCTLSLTLALDRGGWSTPGPDSLYLRKRHGAHCRVGWVGPRSGLDGCGKSRPLRNSIPEPSSP